MEDLKSKGDLSLLILEEIDVIAGRSATASAIDSTFYMGVRKGGDSFLFSGR
jgi:hypothetical protein